MSVVHVAVGVIENAQGQVLIAQRAASQHMGGLWEFPGGKVEAGESLLQALARELREELAIEVHRAEPLIRIPHHYRDKTVELDVWRVTHFEGDPKGAEGQPLMWCPRAELNQYAFPAANKAIVNALTLPAEVVVTGPAQSLEDGLARLHCLLERKPAMIYLRKAEWCESAEAYRQALNVCLAAGANVMVTGEYDIQEAIDQSSACANANLGLHLSSHRLKAVVEGGLLAREPYRWVSAACHNPQELNWAKSIDVDFAFLSPLASTASHPEVPPLGVAEFARLVRAAGLPVYALGGVSPAGAPWVQSLGAQGVAGIRAFWPQSL